ncbi:hypothetical protein FOPE_10497 [Fonsecaea pedrosoi]|nr:hypothetical protein FOPE_10497 [Fonsecaea pedrosoi]
MVHTRGMEKAPSAPPSSTNSTLMLPAPSRRIAGKRIAGKRTAGKRPSGKRGPTKRTTRTPAAPKATSSTGEQPDTDDDSITCWIPAPEVPGLRPVEKNDFHTEGFVCLCYWSPDKTWFAIRICAPNSDPRLQDLLRDLISEAEAWSKKEKKQGGGAGGVPDKTTTIENFIRDTSPSLWYSEDDGGKQLDGYEFTSQQPSWVPQMACMQFDETFARENKLPFVDLAKKDLASFTAKQALLAMNESVQAMPANEEEMPANNEEAMAVDDQEEPANEEDMPGNGGEVMVIDDDQEKPANEGGIPVNDEEVMVIDNQEKPANEGEKAAEKEEKASDEEEKPPGEEEKPTNEQEKPANKEDANDKAAEPEES